MANCVSCSAPLPAPSNICEYCGRRNDVDLHGVHKYTVVRPDSERTCPRCDVALHTINLKSDGRFFIERCDRCMGLFFDPGELESLLEQSVSNVFQIDRNRLNAINKELYQRDFGQREEGQAFYVKCPVCRQFMQRKNFGARSGVIADHCKSHGVWLDGGELKRLLEWKKAGGQLLHEKLGRHKSAQPEPPTASAVSSEAVAETLQRSRQKESSWQVGDDDLVSAVFRLVDRLF